MKIPGRRNAWPEDNFVQRSWRRVFDCLVSAWYSPLRRSNGRAGQYEKGICWESSLAKAQEFHDTNFVNGCFAILSIFKRTGRRHAGTARSSIVISKSYMTGNLRFSISRSARSTDVDEMAILRITARRSSSKWRKPQTGKALAKPDNRGDHLGGHLYRRGMIVRLLPRKVAYEWSSNSASLWKLCITSYSSGAFCSSKLMRFSYSLPLSGLLFFFDVVEYLRNKDLVPCSFIYTRSLNRLWKYEQISGYYIVNGSYTNCD